MAYRRRRYRPGNGIGTVILGFEWSILHLTGVIKLIYLNADENTAVLFGLLAIMAFTSFTSFAAGKALFNVVRDSLFGGDQTRAVFFDKVVMGISTILIMMIFGLITMTDMVS